MRKNGAVKRTLNRILTFVDWATGPLPLQIATGAEAIARRRKKSRRDAGEDDDYSLWTPHLR
ncbi:MAG: hypothetical protein ACTH0P_03640, partial [Candidatus Corynebacterium faecigallinarum]